MLPKSNCYRIASKLRFYRNNILLGFHLYISFKSRIRRLFCGLVVGVDESVGIVVDALKNAGMWDNTIIIYSSDNGGVPYSGGNNRPFR